MYERTLHAAEKVLHLAIPCLLKALAQDIADHKPFIDRLSKVGPNLARLCKEMEAGDINTKLEDVLDRYQSLKSSVRDQTDQLREKDQQAQKVSECADCKISCFELFFVVHVNCVSCMFLSLEALE